MIGAFITFLCMFVLLTGFVINLLIETYKEKEKTSTKVLGWLAVILSFVLTIVFFISSALKIREQAIIDYTKGKYKVNVEVKTDTLKTITRGPDTTILYENYLRQHSRL